MPAASRFPSDQMGGRIRGPSPLIHEWIEFCLQPARGLPFQDQVIPGALPSALGHISVEGREATKGRPELETNIIDGVPPPEILSKCEFLEPLSDEVLEDYQWLISCMQKPRRNWIRGIQYHISTVARTSRLNSK